MIGTHETISPHPVAHVLNCVPGPVPGMCPHPPRPQIRAARALLDVGSCVADQRLPARTTGRMSAAEWRALARLGTGSAVLCVPSAKPAAHLTPDRRRRLLVHGSVTLSRSSCVRGAVCPARAATTTRICWLRRASRWSGRSSMRKSGSTAIATRPHACATCRCAAEPAGSIPVLRHTLTPRCDGHARCNMYLALEVETL